MRVSFWARGLALAAFCLLYSHSAPAQDAEHFKGKTINLIVGGGAGDGYDVYARFLAKHWGKYIPGAPRFVVQNMPGAGTLLAANYIYEKAKNDGTEIGTVGGGTATAQLFKTENIRFDPRRFVWIGSLNSEVGIVLAWNTQPFKSVKDLMEKEMVVGGGGPTSGNVIFPLVLNRVIGTKFKIVAGYKGSADLGLAIERGEISAFAFSWIAVVQQWPHWIAEKKVKPLVVDGLTRDPDMPDLPRLSELTSDPQHRKVLELIGLSSEFGRSYFAPPGVPRDRLAALRAAFAATVKDPDFLADAKKRNLVIEPQTAGELEGFVRQVHALPADVVQLAQNVMGAEN